MNSSVVFLRDEVPVYTETWTPESIKANVVFVHGLGEHIGRYEHVFSKLCESGIRVHSWDQRGFGKSNLNKVWPSAHIGDRKTVLEDVAEAIDRAHIEGIPLYLYGHSMGGLIVLDFASTNMRKITAPALAVPKKTAPHPFVIFLASFVEIIFPSCTIDNGLKVTELTRDVSVLEKLKSDNLLQRRFSLSTLKYIINQGRELMINPSLKDLRLLMVHGGSDSITCPLASKEYFDQIRLNDKKIHIYQNCYHELHNEFEKDDLLTEVTDWILK